jgi:hypothetical protein
MTPHGGRQFLRRALPDTNRFCADALQQIRIAAPKHAILLNNSLATPGAHLDLLSVSFVFMVVPLFCFCWFVYPFTEVLQEIRRDITRKDGELR